MKATHNEALEVQFSGGIIAGFEAIFEDVLLTFLKEMNAESRIAMTNVNITLAP